MEAADALDLIVGHYGERYGVTVLGQALRSIERRDLEEWLLGDGVPPLPADDDATDDASADVSRRWVLAVAPFLDRLQARGALSNEAAAAGATGATPQERMRRLLDTAPGWGPGGHGCLLRALRELQPCLAAELGLP